MFNGPVPHVGGPILPPCCPTVIIGGIPAARVGDMCVCAGPPDTIIKGSATVFIGGSPAARIGDNTVHGGVIVTGFPTVIIGDGAGSGGGGGAAAVGAGKAGSATASSLELKGSDADKKTLGDIVEKIRNSGEKGRAFIEALEKGPTKTQLSIGKSVTKKDGTVISLARTGGGITLRPTESQSGNNEVVVDPTNLIQYQATDGSKVNETPEGLTLHEMGHAKLLNDKDPDQTTGGPDAEKNVRTETNPIREELGMKPEG
jgi:uncharacterized Zn-binding protein involved in type VI secretion